MNRISIAVSAFIATATASTASLAHDHASAKYLGNEGVLVERGDTKVLFDAFYAQGFGNYFVVPAEINAAMMAGEAPYDGIDAIFVSHVHGDHFTAEPAIEYLRAQPQVILFGSKQVHDAILESGIEKDDPVMSRVRSVDLAPEDNGETFELGDLKIDVVSVPHTGSWTKIQNYAWRVSLDEETTVVHLGDADPVVANFSRHQAHFDTKITHTAFPPYWFIGHKEGELILRDVIKANQSIGIHVPKAAAGKGDQWRKKHGGDMFTDPGETRSIGKK